jgi:tRNA (guanine-N1)-methyltransferase
MHLHIITVLPELLESPFAHSILKRAQQKGLVSIDIYNLREFSSDKHKSVDDYAFGGGAGMVMMAEPIVNCLEHIQSKGQIDEVIYMSRSKNRLCCFAAITKEWINAFAIIMLRAKFQLATMCFQGENLLRQWYRMQLSV